jgi:hypothetical protein
MLNVYDAVNDVLGESTEAPAVVVGDIIPFSSQLPNSLLFLQDKETQPLAMMEPMRRKLLAVISAARTR